MNDYRIYRLNSSNRIMGGAWIEASTDAGALEVASGHCGAGTFGVEVWEGARLVGQVWCLEPPRELAA